MDVQPTLFDVQNSRDERGVAINHVGVTDLRWPVVVLDRQQGEQQTVAMLTASVGLPHHFKGTHMSRFIEVLNEHRGELTMRTLPAILRQLKERLDAESARIEVRFPYFLERVAPVSGCKALMDYECSFIGESNGGHDDFVLGVRVPVTSVCPCSKAISDYGGPQPARLHFRRGAGRPGTRRFARVDLDRGVEVRTMAIHLQADPRVRWFRVRVINHESLHHHNAFAEVEFSRGVPAGGG